MASKDLLKVIPLLERLSLIRFANEGGIKRLNEAIEFANHLQEVNVDGVQPMISPNEGKCIHMRDDISVVTNKDEITQNAVHLIEGYFVAPNQ
ncbi:glutamyl-tRNA(Gln) amidotransferase subunit C, mitochondrial-like [Oppia nitens]|uniref:glutamyl-tRNA(Gln) amidotransferase subunit C, mitochondrial-like n=1 Tax=Oppia nitens TaxID=1686743 RepID=UPI0023DC7B6F|nr:glutamyl-tRNA(Gln) amidotransferase subunit C, mitochondrial-like [Oppia nitens]